MYLDHPQWQHPRQQPAAAACSIFNRNTVTCHVQRVQLAPSPVQGTFMPNSRAAAATAEKPHALVAAAPPAHMTLLQTTSIKQQPLEVHLKAAGATAAAPGGLQRTLSKPYGCRCRCRTEAAEQLAAVTQMTSKGVWITCTSWGARHQPHRCAECRPPT
jgi:hypothetical protein